jgi:hypothetical protein
VIVRPHLKVIKSVSKRRNSFDTRVNCDKKKRQPVRYEK